MKELKNLLLKEYTRGEFLLFVGTLLLTVFGVLDTLNRINKTVSNVSTQTLSGYGYSSYGSK